MGCHQMWSSNTTCVALVVSTLITRPNAKLNSLSSGKLHVTSTHILGPWGQGGCCIFELEGPKPPWH